MPNEIVETVDKIENGFLFAQGFHQPATCLVQISSVFKGMIMLGYFARTRTEIIMSRSQVGTIFKFLLNGRMLEIVCNDNKRTKKGLKY